MHALQLADRVRALAERLVRADHEVVGTAVGHLLEARLATLVEHVREVGTNEREIIVVASEVAHGPRVVKQVRQRACEAPLRLLSEIGHQHHLHVLVAIVGRSLHHEAAHKCPDAGARADDAGKRVLGGVEGERNPLHHRWVLGKL